MFQIPFSMFFTPFQKKQADVQNHWIALAENFRCDSSEFYSALEKELQNRQVPGMETLRVEYAQGGLLSDKRIYLRMLRERLVFDVCAAPFGTSFFFSCRTAEIPLVVHIWQLAILVFSFFILLWLSMRYIGFFYGPFMLAILLIVIAYVLRNAVAMGLKDLDAALIQSPLFGTIYETWFRKETYYRVDTRLMYMETVSTVVKKMAEEVTAEKGIKLVCQYQYAPVLGELYKPVMPAPDIARPI